MTFEEVARLAEMSSLSEGIGGVGGQTRPFTPGEFRKALGFFPTGVAVVTCLGPDGLLHGVTVSSFNSVSLEPPLVLFSLARIVLSFSAWQAASVWGISVLGETQDGLSTRFAQSAGGKWLGFEPMMGATGVALIPGALAHFECERYAVHDGGDHLIFVGRVLALGRPTGLALLPLVFFAGRYHRLDQPRQGASEHDECLLHGW
jgi:flavin reductase (DIM6/NTAB) family NADH-FMN oxidoreductase RutF